jgi:glucarate dehydratase
LLRKRFPKQEGYEIRIDPNAVWTVETARRVAKEIEQYDPQYLEDPCQTIEQHATLKTYTDIPMASNMAVSAFTTFPPNVKFGGIDIVLGELHNRGGFLAFKEFGMLCRVFGWGLGGHSNNALGVSQAAMIHACAATPELAYAADTHYPWTDSDGDIIKGGKLQFHDGKMDVPDGPGLGVEIDEDALAQRHEQLLAGPPSDRREMVLSLLPGTKVPDAEAPITNFPRYAKPRW